MRYPSSSTWLIVVAAVAALNAFGADDATVTLRREHRLESLELIEQQAREALPPKGEPAERSARGRTKLELQAQEQLHAEQLRRQLQSAQIRQTQEPGVAAGQAQFELQHMRREREAARLQREILRPVIVKPRP